LGIFCLDGKNAMLEILFGIEILNQESYGEHFVVQCGSPILILVRFLILNQESYGEHFVVQCGSPILILVRFLF
jgi:hypothetical protein